MNKKFLGFVLVLCSLSIRGSSFQSIQDYIQYQQELKNQADSEEVPYKEIQLTIKMIPEMMNPEFLNSEAGLLFIARYGIEIKATIFATFNAPLFKAQKYNASTREIEQLSQQLYTQIGVNKQEVEFAFNLLQKIPNPEQKIHQKFKDFLSQQG